MAPRLTAVDSGGLRDARSPAPAVTRAAAILGLLAQSSESVGLAELARRLDLPKSSIANLLVALEDADLVRKVDGRYRLGHFVLELGSAYIGSNSLLRDFADTAAELPAGSQETLLLAQLDGTDVLYLARHDGTQPIRLACDIGRRLPANCTALGKAMLAQLDPAVVAERYRQLSAFPRLSERSLRNVDALLEDLERTRARGYAIDDEENTIGVTCYGVAIPRHDPAEPPRAVSVTMLKARVTDAVVEQLVANLAELAARLGRRSSMTLAAAGDA
jgi:DNA-binding IclR family transcriptional regulator